MHLAGRFCQRELPGRVFEARVVKAPRVLLWLFPDTLDRALHRPSPKTNFRHARPGPATSPIELSNALF